MDNDDATGFDFLIFGCNYFNLSISEQTTVKICILMPGLKKKKTDFVKENRDCQNPAIHKSY